MGVFLFYTVRLYFGCPKPRLSAAEWEPMQLNAVAENALNPKKIGGPEQSGELAYKINIQCIVSFHFSKRPDCLSLSDGSRADFEGRIRVMPCFFNKF